MHADCSRCFALCCVALPFAASADFPATKRGGDPCGNLRADYGCGVHARLRDTGYRGCTVFDCFGAGQQVSQVTFGGVSWRTAPDTARAMFDVFPVMRQLHELLWHLSQALTLPAARPLYADLARTHAMVTAHTESDAATLATLDVSSVRRRTGTLLRRTSDLARASVPGRKRDHANADLMGAQLRQARLRGACLRNAYLIGADLTGADLRTADFLGADLRDARLADADLTGALFLTQPQLNAAHGNPNTRLPPTLRRPPHWPA
nr:pentapeptide repeat-containing protein [Streptomyces sp. JJ66]